MPMPARRVVALTKPPRTFNGVKIFSATMFAERQCLGDGVTEWLRANSHVEIVDIVVTQSSDAGFHCVAISVFYTEQVAVRRRGKR